MKGRVKGNKTNSYYRSGMRSAQAEMNDESGDPKTQAGPPRPDKPGPSNLPFVDDMGPPIELPPPDPMEESVIRRFPYEIPSDASTTPGLEDQWDVLLPWPVVLCHLLVPVSPVWREPVPGKPPQRWRQEPLEVRLGPHVKSILRLSSYRANVPNTLGILGSQGIITPKMQPGSVRDSKISCSMHPTKLPGLIVAP